jgi:hypothetical protein
MIKITDNFYFTDKTNEIIAVLKGELDKNIPDDILKQIALDQYNADIEAIDKAFNDTELRTKDAFINILKNNTRPK